MYLWLGVDAGAMRAPALLLLAASVAAFSGCSDGSGFSFDVQVYNDSAEAVELRVRAVADDGTVATEVSGFVPSGYSSLGELGGSAGDYTVEATAFGERAAAGPGQRLERGSSCTVYLANPAPVQVACTT